MKHSESFIEHIRADSASVRPLRGNVHAHSEHCFQFFIGNGEAADASAESGPCLLHGPDYDFTDKSISLGGQAWRLAVELLRRPSAGPQESQ
jgi:hypothetical protein